MAAEWFARRRWRMWLVGKLLGRAMETWKWRQVARDSSLEHLGKGVAIQPHRRLLGLKGGARAHWHRSSVLACGRSSWEAMADSEAVRCWVCGLCGLRRAGRFGAGWDNPGGGVHGAGRRVAGRGRRVRACADCLPARRRPGLRLGDGGCGRGDLCGGRAVRVQPLRRPWLRRPGRGRGLPRGGAHRFLHHQLLRRGRAQLLRDVDGDQRRGASNQPHGDPSGAVTG